MNAGIFLSEKKVPTLPDNISARTRSSAKSVTDSKKGAKPKGGKLFACCLTEVALVEKYTKTSFPSTEIKSSKKSTSSSSSSSRSVTSNAVIYNHFFIKLISLD